MSGHQESSRHSSSSGSFVLDSLHEPLLDHDVPDSEVSIPVSEISLETILAKLEKEESGLSPYDLFSAIDQEYKLPKQPVYHSKSHSESTKNKLYELDALKTYLTTGPFIEDRDTGERWKNHLDRLEEGHFTAADIYPASLDFFKKIQNVLSDQEFKILLRHHFGWKKEDDAYWTEAEAWQTKKTSDELLREYYENFCEEVRASTTTRTNQQISRRPAAPTPRYIAPLRLATQLFSTISIGAMSLEFLFIPQPSYLKSMPIFQQIINTTSTYLTQEGLLSIPTLCLEKIREHSLNQLTYVSETAPIALPDLGLSVSDFNFNLKLLAPISVCLGIPILLNYLFSKFSSKISATPIYAFKLDLLLQTLALGFMSFMRFGTGNGASTHYTAPLSTLVACSGSLTPFNTMTNTTGTPQLFGLQDYNAISAITMIGWSLSAVSFLVLLAGLCGKNFFGHARRQSNTAHSALAPNQAPLPANLTSAVYYQPGIASASAAYQPSLPPTVGPYAA